LHHPNIIAIIIVSSKGFLREANVPMAVDASYQDLSSPDTFVPGALRNIRQAAKREPGLLPREPEGPGFWCVTRYHDLVTVNRDNQLFSSNKRTALFMEVRRGDARPAAADDAEHGPADAHALTGCS